MEVNAKAGLNQTIWGMNEITGERPASDLQQMRARFERFGMSGEDLEQRIAQARYMTKSIQPGEFTIVLEMNGKKQSKDTRVLQDIWYKK